MTQSSTEVSDTTQTLNVGEEAQKGAEDQKDQVEPSVVEQQGTDAAGASNQIDWESLLQPGDVDEKTEKAMSNSKSVQDFSTSDESDVTSTPGTGLKTSQPETNWQETRWGHISSSCDNLVCILVGSCFLMYRVQWLQIWKGGTVA